MNTRALVVVILVMSTMALCGCETPTSGFEAFYAAVADGKAETALDRLTPSARASLEDGAAAAHMKLADALLQATVRSTLREIREVSRDGDVAVLEVTDALGHTEKTRMKKIDGRWKVDGAAP